MNGRSAIGRNCRWLAAFALASPLWVLPRSLASQENPVRSGPSVVAGRVLDYETGRPVSDAVVSLRPDGTEDASGTSRRTDGNGSYRFEEVEPGGYVLRVAFPGYRVFEDSLAVAPGSVVSAVVSLSASPIELEPLVAVTARRPAFMDGFEERRALDLRHTGFFTADEIVERHPRDLSDLMWTVPGVNVGIGPFGQRIRVASDAGRPMNCRPDVWVNGSLMDPEVPYDYIYQPEDIAAVELYALQHDVPSQFLGPHRCGALVIWLREPGPDEPDGPSWKSLMIWPLVLGGLTLLLR